ncbi:hypothetical protein ACHAPX_000560 [Trichoderma viride]
MAQIWTANAIHKTLAAALPLPYNQMTGTAANANIPWHVKLKQSYCSNGSYSDIWSLMQEKLPPFEKRFDDQYSILASDCEQLREALEALPQQRDRMDALVLSFFQNVNPHYSLIHQAEFAAEYAAWWEARAKNEPLPVPWTCLLLTLCACACQHLPVDIQERLEEMFHAQCQDLTEKYHYHARMLYAVIPEGQYYRHNVMWMLHSTYWYKAEALFAECCHVFITAVREAQELGFNREERGEHLSSFEREMRRRAWCIIDSWDWQIASGLGRDTLIDHSMCNVQRPSLTLELDGQFSPLMHMNMQSDLVHKLAERFHSPAKITTPNEVMEYKGMIDEWMRNLPAIFALENPDTSHDEEQTWIEYHRYYNYTMGFMMLLNPFRQHMRQSFEQDTPEEQLKLRTIAVNMAIRLVKVLDDWVNYLTFRDGRFHFIIFSLVDAATMLTDVIRNDKARTATRRYEMYQTLEKSRLLQGKLQCLSKSADKGFRIVHKTFKRLMKDAPKEDYVYLPDGKDDTEQEVLRAALESISLSAENRMDSGKQRRKAREALTEGYAAKSGLESLPFSHAENCHECQENHVNGENGALESAHYGIAATVLPDYYVAASEDHILPTSSTYLAAPADYTVAAPPIDLAATSSYVEPPRNPGYNEPLPLEYITSAPLDYTTAAPLTVPATASAYVKPIVSDRIFSVPLGDAGVAFSNNAVAPILYGNTLPIDYGAITCSGFDASLPLGYPTTVPPYDNAMFPVYNASAYFENTGVIPADNDTTNIPPFSAPTVFGSLLADQIQPFPGYDATGLDTTYGSYGNVTGPQDLVSSTAPMIYATPATSVSQSSPENLPYSETFGTPALYNTAASYSDPTSCVDSATSSTSPESNSSANYDAAVAHSAMIATAAGGLYTHTEYSEDTAQQHQHF